MSVNRERLMTLVYVPVVSTMGRSVQLISGFAHDMAQEYSNSCWNYTMIGNRCAGVALIGRYHMLLGSDGKER